MPPPAPAPPETRSLSGAQRRHLRGLAHPLAPVVQVGKHGVSVAVTDATDVALYDHELIKVRLPQVERDARREMADALVHATGAHEVGVTGRVLVLYRQNPDEPKIRLPRG